VALLAGAAIAAHAQSVANLPPAGAQPNAAVPAPAYAAPQVNSPNPGSNVNIPSTARYQKPADWNTNRAYHPYSTSGAGPNPGSNVSANNEPRPLPPSAEVTAPYSQKGDGPNPGR
jgi:hypothetical protein